MQITGRLHLLRLLLLLQQIRSVSLKSVANPVPRNIGGLERVALLASIPNASSPLGCASLLTLPALAKISTTNLLAPKQGCPDKVLSQVRACTPKHHFFDVVVSVSASHLKKLAPPPSESATQRIERRHISLESAYSRAQRWQPSRRAGKVLFRGLHATVRSSILHTTQRVCRNTA